MTKNKSLNFLLQTLGCLISAAGIYSFAVAAGIPVTGVAGISAILYRLFGVPMGLSNVLINIPIILCTYKLLGRAFFLRSVYCMILFAISTDYVLPLLPVYQGDRLLATLERLSAEYRDVVKIGRTHLQDAVPLTLGQEISGWSAMLGHDRVMLTQACGALRELALGGTAVGTGLNAPAAFGDLAAAEISALLGYSFESAPNKFHALTSKDQMVFAHGALKALAADLMKIANDVRWLASGPRCGIGELIIPANEPGSSIMPGKVNPTQCEAVTMVAVQVMGNDTAIGFAASQGNFQLNVFLPVTIYNFLQSARLLADVMDSFEANCVRGIRPNYDAIQAHLDASLMLVTALNPHIGYENAARIAKHAHATGQTLKAAAVELGLLTAEEFDAWVRPENMVHPKQED